MRLQAISIGQVVPVSNFGGVVHSVFHHACNILAGEDEIYTLLSSGSGNSPQGILLDVPSGFSFLDFLDAGQLAISRAGILRFRGGSLEIDLRSARVWQVDLRSLSADWARPGVIQAWRVAWRELEAYPYPDGPAGFVALLVHIDRTPGDGHTPAAQAELVAWEAWPSIHDLFQATWILQMETAALAARSLVGLGPGLTPSGDDFLTGFLAGLWSTAGGNGERWAFLSVLGERILSAACATTMIGRSYLCHAVRGRISEPLAALAGYIAGGRQEREVQAAARRALRVGSTSGADGVLGLLLGLAAWQT